MPIIEFSRQDILRSKLITPGWYRIRIDSVSESLSKDGNSTNWPLEGTVLFNADNGDKEFAGCPAPYWNFNSQPRARGFMIGFFASLGVEVKEDSRFELNNTIGKELDVFIENEMYEGRLLNRINHKYRQIRAVESV